jgi:maltose alpha-D-glucosyltransferase/alpha-amylase
VSAAFLRAYLAESAKGSHLPKTMPEIEVLLDAHLLEKALYEVVYELNNRPDWLRIPVHGVLDLLGGSK